MVILYKYWEYLLFVIILHLVNKYNLILKCQSDKKIICIKICEHSSYHGNMVLVLHNVLLINIY